MDTVITQITASAIVVYAIEQLKKSTRVNWITAESTTLSRWLSGVGAAISAFGVQTAMSGDAASGWSVTIAIPSLAALLQSVWVWANQLALNQLIFDGVVKSNQKPSVATAGPVVYSGDEVTGATRPVV